MRTIQVVAGLPQAYVERLRTISANAIVPDGKLIYVSNRASNSYDPDHSERLLSQATAYAKGLDEAMPLRTLLIYVDYGDDTTSTLLDAFFPFALPYALKLPEIDYSKGKKWEREALNQFEGEIRLAIEKLREKSEQVAAVTSLPNLTPLLLPVGNFSNRMLVTILRRLYLGLAHAANVEAAIGQEVATFLIACPWVRQANTARCLSDSILYFRSPGKARHGFFRHTADSGHSNRCLLAARSRLGGTYDYRFHYDCTSTRGSLNRVYPSCHGQDGDPREDHVNIAPNDYVV